MWSLFSCLIAPESRLQLLYLPQPRSESCSLDNGEFRAVAEIDVASSIRNFGDGAQRMRGEVQEAAAMKSDILSMCVRGFPQLVYT